MSLGSTSKLVLAFVTLIIGAVLIGSIATNGLAVTDKKSVSDEAIDISTARDANGDINTSVTFTITSDNVPLSWQAADCPLSSIVYGNSSTDYTVTTDYTFATTTGVLTLVNSTAVIEGGNSTLIDYIHCGDDYMNLSWGRTLINLIAGFFAIAILLVSVGLFYDVAKDNNII